MSEEQIQPFLSDHLLQVSMPSGNYVFELFIQGKRWSRHRGHIEFNTRLASVPSDIMFSNITMDGVADLRICEITDTGFSFEVVSTLSSAKWHMTSIEFEWEAIK